MNDAPAPIFRRILLKLSGESLMGDLDYGTDPKRLREVAEEIKRVHDRGVEIAAEVAGLPNSLVTRQVANGVAVRMAVLFLLLGSGGDIGT